MASRRNVIPILLPFQQMKKSAPPQSEILWPTVSDHQLPLRTQQNPNPGAASSRTPASAAAHVELSNTKAGQVGRDLRVPKFGTTPKQNFKHKQKN
jgi:hypothetical protein